MTPEERQTMHTALQVARQLEAEVARLTRRLTVAENNIHTLNGKIERLKGTHGY